MMCTNRQKAKACTVLLSKVFRRVNANRAVGQAEAPDASSARAGHTRGPRKVVLIAEDVGGLGGMERQTARLVSGLLDAGWGVTVVSRTCALDPRDGLRFIRVPVPRRPFTLTYPAFALAATLLATRRGNALLHTTGGMVANRADVSSVHYCHRAAQLIVGRRQARNMYMYRINSAIAARFAVAGEAWCYRPGRTRLLCAVSPGVARELRTHYPSMAHAIRTVPNGVDLSEFAPDEVARCEFRAALGIAADKRLALFAGGDWPRKGLKHAVEALGLAPGWHLAVAGNGDADAILAVAAAAGAAGRVHILGQVRDMPKVYASADAFVFPTAYEAWPLAVLEAAATGLPLLVTPVSGAEDFVVNDFNGWLIRPDAADIARRLNELARDPRVQARMSEQARASAADFTWETMIEGYLAVYGELIDNV